MIMARLIAMLGLMIVLAAPAMAADSASLNRQQQFGDLIIHYNAFASGLLQPTIAKNNGLIRSKEQAVINVAVLKGDKTVTAGVDGSVADLTGRKKELSFRPVSENGSVNYIAQFAVEPDSSATYIFTINVKAGDGDTHTLSFNQQIFSDQ
jgi:hypothetical protein